MAEEIQIESIPKSDILERRRRYMVRWVGLKAERSRQWSKWVDLTDYIMPERGRFLTSDHNKPKVTNKILNSTPTRVARALASALMSGGTSPARPWFGLELPYTPLNKIPKVKRWLAELTESVRQVLNLSGFYRAAASGVYPDIVTYGTACALVEEDDDTVVRFLTFPIGSYALGLNGKGEVNAIFYEQAWTVVELVNEFGFENVSGTVKGMYNAGQYEAYVDVLRVIAPNAEFIPGSFGKKGMKWGSAWMEMGGLTAGSGANAQQNYDINFGFLRDSGYEEFPGLCPRWSVTGRDAYGTGPGHDAIPDCKQLMIMESRALLALSKGVNPPMLVPDSMRMQRLSMQPGDPVYVPAGMNGVKIEPAQVVHPQFLGMTEAKIGKVENRIGQSFFAELVLMLIDDERKQPSTAEEVRAKQQEKMLQLGPVLENLNDEFLTPLINRVLAIMMRRGLVPPAPKEIQGMELKVVFTSILAQAQKLIGTTAKERLVQFVGQNAQLLGPNAVDNIAGDRLIKAYADDLGVAPDAMATEEEIQAARQMRAQQAQQAAQQQAMLAAAKSARDMAGAELGNRSMLSALMGDEASGEPGAEEEVAR